MKRMLKTTVAALTLGFATLTPTFAKADDHGRFDNHRDAGRGHVEVRHDDRRDVRVARPEVRVERDVRVVHRDVPVYRHDRVIVETPAPVYVAPVPVVTSFAVSVGDVPVRVMDTLNCETRGGIESVTLVRNDGPDYYRFLVRDGRSDLEVRIGCDGHLISMTHC